MSHYATPFMVLGEKGITDLVEAFYAVMDSADYAVMDSAEEAREIRGLHAADLGPVKRRWTDYLIEWTGGPPHYRAKRGSMCMTGRHAGYWIGPRERDQWLWCMESAQERCAVPEEVRQMLKRPLAQIADAVCKQRSDHPGRADPNIVAAG